MILQDQNEHLRCRRDFEEGKSVKDSTFIDNLIFTTIYNYSCVAKVRN